MSVAFSGKLAADVTVSIAVSANSGGAVLADYVWQNITDPRNPQQLYSSAGAEWSSSVIVKAADIAAAPMQLYSMLVSLISTDDSTVWAWASQGGTPLKAFDAEGNALQPQGPHNAVSIGTCKKGQTDHEAVSIALS
jgi:hypothetical protein